LHVGDRRFFKKITQPLFTDCKVMLEAQPIELGRGAPCKDLECRDSSWLGRHRLLIEHAEMPEYGAVLRLQGHA